MNGWWLFLTFSLPLHFFLLHLFLTSLLSSVLWNWNLIFGNPKQDPKRFGAENKDTGYSSSSSSSNGVSKLSSLNCQNCTVLCNDLKASPVGSFCTSCFQHWRFVFLFSIFRCFSQTIFSSIRRTGVLRPTQVTKLTNNYYFTKKKIYSQTFK